ncbi:MAG: hypothetical protein SLRJCFUN_002403 [Candidatus Fervidibacter sp.]|jgi:hypothetical protein
MGISGEPFAASFSPFGFLPLLLKGFEPPKEPFDPNGEWALTYRLFVVGVIAEKYRQWGCVPSGTLQVKRAPMRDGTFILQVNLVSNQSIEHHGRGIDRIEAEVTHRNDSWASILSWRRVSWLLTQKRQLVTAEVLGIDAEDLELGIKLEMSGRVENGQIVLKIGSRERKIKAPSPLTCDWALIDVVQRMAQRGDKRLNFAVLEELEFLRKNQRLVLREPMEIEVDGRKFRWHRIEQFGDGVLPWTYCLDEHHRLILAFSAMRAIVLA